MRKIFIAVFLLSVMFSLSSCASQEAEGEKSLSPIAVKDMRSKEIRLNKPAQRVVCLFNPILDGMYMLGATEQLVGVPLATLEDKEHYDYYKWIDSRVRDKTLATPGSHTTPNVESIVSLKPDLVILHYTQDKAAEKLEQIGIPVYLCVSQEWQEMVKEFKDIGILLGREKRADSIVQYAQQELDKIEQQNKSDGKRKQKSVYFTWAYGRIFTTIGTKGMMNTCLVLAGARNVCTAPIYRVSVDPENLIKWNPDAIIMWNDSPAAFYNRKEFQGISAIKNKQIYNLTPMFFYNLHNMKALCAVLRIYNVLYGTKGDDIAAIKQIMNTLYGKEIGEKLSESL